MSRFTLGGLLGLLVLATATPLKAADDFGIELPPVPRALLAAAWSGEGEGGGGGGALRHVAATTEGGAATAPALELGPRIVRVSPGTTAIVEVAIDHLNRIVTPFAAPQVRTVSQATTQVDGNVVYVATASEEPVSLYITDGDDPATALALTLAPRHVPPREVRLVPADGVLRRAAFTSARAKDTRGERDAPYVERLAAAFRELAQNRVPAGFGLRAAGRAERVTCRQAGLVVTTGQVLEGHDLKLLTARVRNSSRGTLELEERACTSAVKKAVAAVAAWPRVRLAPGEETELYVAVRAREPERERRDRPSLLGGTR